MADDREDLLWEELGMLQRLYMVEDSQGKEEDGDGHRCQPNQGDIDGAVKSLTRTAFTALGQVLLVVRPHLRRDPGNVIPPTG